MDHPLFGKIKHRGDAWHGHVRLPAFAGSALRGVIVEAVQQAEFEQNPEQLQQTLDQMSAAMDGMKEKIAEKYGNSFADVFAAMDRELKRDIEKVEDDAKKPKSAKKLAREQREAEREAKEAARKAKAHQRLAEGLFPFQISTDDGTGDHEGEELPPTPAQEAAFRHLTGNEAAIYEAVTSQIWESFQNAYDQEYWRRMCDLMPASSLAGLEGQYSVSRVTLSRESYEGTAYLVFDIDSRWRDEHGLVVVVHPSKSPEWSTYDGLYDLTESDEPDEGGPPPEDPLGFQLGNAIMNGEDELARELIARGADINEIVPDAYPPLRLAVEHMEVENVRRLLAYGADPRLVDDEKKTPLQAARKMYKEMGFGPQKKRRKDDFLGAMLDELKGTPNDPTAGMKPKLDEIIALLEAAEAK